MKPSLISRKSRMLRLLWVGELGLLVLAVLTAARLRFLGDASGHEAFLIDGPLRALVFASVLTLAMAAFGLYQVHVRLSRMDFGLRLLVSFVFGSIGLLVLYYLLPQLYIGRGVLAMSLAAGMLGVVALRAVMLWAVGADAFKRRVLVFGAGANACLINARLRRRTDRGSFVLLGFIPAPDQPVMVPDGLRLETNLSLVEAVNLLHADEVVVAVDERRGALPMAEMLASAQQGVIVSDLATFFEREAGVVRLDVADPSSLVFSGGFDHSLPRQLGKRLFDLLAASALLLVAWPAMLSVALAIWWEDGAPIFYRQTRVGLNGRQFELVKFRSMRTDAEGDGVARWARRDDDRSTRVGRFIRKVRLDELPQLVNVLRGEMSFVGPRPERPQFVDMLCQEVRYYDVRHCMKPGLTGWAQLRYPYGASVEDAAEKLTFDLFYVKNHGLLFDLMILVQTVEVVLFRRGAR